MLTRKLFTTLAAVALVGACAATVQATPGSNATSEPLARGTFEDLGAHYKHGEWKVDVDTKGATDVVVTRFTIAPGGWLGWHSHPGISIVTVKQGTVSFYLGSDTTCTAQKHPAGTGFVDPGGRVHTVRNEGTEDVVVISTAIVPKGVPNRIDEPSPGNCPF